MHAYKQKQNTRKIIFPIMTNLQTKCRSKLGFQKEFIVEFMW